MLHKILKNKDNELYCEKCDYLAKRKGDFKKHLESKKHKSPECYINATQYFSYCCPCGKKYKHHEETRKYMESDVKIIHFDENYVPDDQVESNNEDNLLYGEIF